jgi:hypothetical protein
MMRIKRTEHLWMPMVDRGALVVFTHAVAILAYFVVGGVFDSTGPRHWVLRKGILTAT